MLRLLLQVLTLIVAAAPTFDERAISNCLHGLAALELSQEREVIAALLGQAESTGGSSRALFVQHCILSAWVYYTSNLLPCGHRVMGYNCVRVCIHFSCSSSAWCPCSADDGAWHAILCCGSWLRLLSSCLRT
jgi:hypothetical protein